MNPWALWVKWWRGHGTRILGLAQGTIAVVAQSTDLFPAERLKWVLLISALLTYWRGQTNSKTDAPPPAGG